jgi:hypothetical protein
MSLGGASGFIQPGINAALENQSNATDYQTGGYSPYGNYAATPYLPYAQQGPYQAIMSQMSNYGGGLGSGYQQGIGGGLFGGSGVSNGAMGGFNPDLYKRAPVAAAVAPVMSDMQYREFLGGGGGDRGEGRGGNASSGGGEGPGGMGRGGGMGGGGMGGDGGGGGFAKGGHVSMQQLQGPNPMGPDDGYGALKSGEYVIKDSAVKKYGIDLMNAINSGKISKGKLRGLLEM